MQYSMGEMSVGEIYSKLALFSRHQIHDSNLMIAFIRAISDRKAADKHKDDDAQRCADFDEVFA